MRIWLILSCGLLTGCMTFYTPPVKEGTDPAKYRTDLIRCRHQVNYAASRANNATVGSAILSQFKSDAPQRHDMTACMNAKGYASK